MSARDGALATLIALLWGFGFIAVKLALVDFSAPQLTALRFLVAALPALAIARPAMPWMSLLAIGLALFTGQFLLLFLAFVAGLPPGLASVTQQTQAVFTLLLAAVWLGERPSRRQLGGLAIGCAGLLLIAGTAGADVPLAALGLALGGALSWAIGNILVKRAPAVPMLSLVTWCSLVPPGPALLVGALDDGHPGLLDSVTRASWLSLAATVYLGLAATTLGYALWAHLLRRHTAAALAPFALLAPCAAITTSAMVFGETVTPLRGVGMTLILAGVAVIVGRTNESAGPGFRRDQRPVSSDPRV